MLAVVIEKILWSRRIIFSDIVRLLCLFGEEFRAIVDGLTFSHHLERCGFEVTAWIRGLQKNLMHGTLALLWFSGLYGRLGVNARLRVPLAPLVRSLATLPT